MVSSPLPAVTPSSNSSTDTSTPPSTQTAVTTLCTSVETVNNINNNDAVHTIDTHTSNVPTIASSSGNIDTIDHRKQIESQEAPIPLLYDSVKHKIMQSHFDDDNPTQNQQTFEMLQDELIHLWTQCLDNKLLHWRNTTKLVLHCFELHNLFMDKLLQNSTQSQSRISLEYIALYTHILSHSSMNQRKMNAFLQDLQRQQLLNGAIYEVLVRSCYNQYTGDSRLAHFIYCQMKEHRIAPNQTILNEIFTTCIKRGDIETAFKLLQQTMRDDSGALSLYCILKVFTVCSVKHSVFYADKLMRQVLFDRTLSKIFKHNETDIIHHYLHVCSVCGNFQHALNLVQQFEPHSDLKTLDLLIRTLTTNAEIYRQSQQQQRGRGGARTRTRSWHGVLPKNHKLYLQRDMDQTRNPPWTELITSSLELFQHFQRVLHEHARDTQHTRFINKLFDRLCFFASRYEHNGARFLAVSKYVQQFKPLRLLDNASIVGQLLRGCQHYGLSNHALWIWRQHRKGRRQTTPAAVAHHDADVDGGDKDAKYPYSMMLRICCYNMSKSEYRELAKRICTELEQNGYLGDQQLFDAALNFWSGNDDTTLHFLENEESRMCAKNAHITRTPSTYCAFIRHSMKRNNLSKALLNISEAMTIISDRDDNLFRVIFRAYCHFKLHSQSLELLKECMSRFADNRYVIKYGIFSLIKTYVECKRYDEILEIVLNADDATHGIFELCFTQQWITYDSICLLFYCCYKADNLDALLFLMNICIDNHRTRFRTATYNYFVQLLINRFGQFSDVVLSAIAQFVSDGVFHFDYDTHTLNIFDSTHHIVPALIHCFISQYIECKSNQHTFTIVCYPHFVRAGRYQRTNLAIDNYRLLYGENNDFLLFTAYYHLQNYYYPPIECEWKFGSDEIQCNMTQFMNKKCTS